MTEVCPLHGAGRCPRWCGWHDELPIRRTGDDSDPLVVACCAFVLAFVLVMGVIAFALTHR